MAHVRNITDWKPLRFFPWVERRVVAAFLATNPNVMLDLLCPWSQYRWRRIRK